jgi:hypothetical protein
MILATTADKFGEHEIGLDECMKSVGVKTILSFYSKDDERISLPRFS